MHLPDTNVWLATALKNHPHYKIAQVWFNQRTAATVAYCRATQLALVRLLTTASVMQGYNLPPMTNAVAWQMYEDQVADARIAWADETPSLEAQWKKLALRRTASPKLWMDAYLAAFAIEGKHKIVTFDRAFAQFKGLDVVILETANTV